MAVAQGQLQTSNAGQPVGPVAQQLAVLQAASSQPAPASRNSTSSRTPQRKNRWAWTGFWGYDPPNDKHQRGKTLWDWLQLLIIPVILAGGGIWFSTQQNDAGLRLNKQQYEQSMHLTENQQKETTLKTAMDDLSGLILDKGLRASPQNAEVRVVARAKILAAFRLIDPPRKRTLLQFLIEAQLVTRVFNRSPLLSLRGAALDHASLGGAHLEGANLNGANLSGADLRDAYLEGANLTNTQMDAAHLESAHLEGHTFLSSANLENAHLENAHLSDADLHDAHLEGAYLRGAHLEGAHLEGAHLIHADLSNAVLRNANLRNITSEHANWSGTIMPNGSKHR